MSDFIKDINNIKAFKKHLDDVLSNIENGGKLDFEVIVRLNELITNYNNSNSTNNSPNSSLPNYTNIMTHNDNSMNPPILDAFLNNILQNNYNNIKKRQPFSSYESFKTNLLNY